MTKVDLRLNEFESESIYILREAYKKLGKLGIKLIVHTNWDAVKAGDPESIQSRFSERPSHSRTFNFVVN